MVKFSWLTAQLCAVFSLGLASAAIAQPIYSGSGSATCELNIIAFGSTDCSLQNIAAHSAWQQAGIGDLAGSPAVWVSYADTGVDGSTLALLPRNSDQIETTPWLLKVTETFTLDNGGGNILMQIWADDTADVFLDGVKLNAANFSQDVCADGGLGCEPGEYFLLNQGLTAGLHELEIFIYQLGIGNTPQANPFGVLYSGEISQLTPSEMPAPATALFLLGTMPFVLRRRKR